MTKKKEAAQIIAEVKLVVILRQIPLDGLRQTAAALRDAGVQVVEVAMNSADATHQLRLLQEYGFCVGAGTILHKEEAEKAIQAGARFLFSPIRAPFFLPLCRKRRVLGIPGGLTPTEIYTLFEEGAEFIKLFPSVPLGPDYVRQILTPCPSLRLIPTGGVTLDLAERFFRSGAAAVALGKEIANRGFVEEKRFDKITHRARSFVTLVESFRTRNSPSQR